MATLLLIIIYIAFIGLGIPDSLFGPAWPVMHEDFGIPVWVAGYITPLFSVFSLISSVYSASVINRFGIGKVTAVSTAMTAVGLLGYSVSPSILWILIFAIPLGFGAGAIDSGLNNYVALHYDARQMSFLHCFYGVGVSLSPYIMSVVLKNGEWREGYRGAGIIQLVITAIVIAALPLWSRVKHKYNILDDGAGGDIEPKTVGILKLSKNPAIRFSWLCFFSACAIEIVSGTWGSTFLVEAKGLLPEQAARVIMFYYVGITLGRFISGLLAVRLTSWKIMTLGFCVLAAALVMIVLPLPTVFASVGLFLIGLGIGPMYPNLMHLTPINFGADISQSVISSQMVAAYAGVMLMPGVLGLIVKICGAGAFSLFNLFVGGLFIFAFIMLMKEMKKNGKFRF
ncbi:MAG: MFS transporter [Ruminococcaceae bacterium]|nr:MFS transporter [Oscillospiraceae bacterium]